MPENIGLGTSIVFLTSGFTANMLDIVPPKISRKDIPRTNLATTGAHTSSPSRLLKTGPAKIEFEYDPGTEPPIDQPIESIRITFPDGEYDQFTGYMTELERKAPIEDMMTAAATIVVTGLITHSTATGTGTGTGTGAGTASGTGAAPTGS